MDKKMEGCPQKLSDFARREIVREAVKIPVTPLKDSRNERKYNTIKNYFLKTV